eukprot:5161968-Pyramimonas_sp.AAC.1
MYAGPPPPPPPPPRRPPPLPPLSRGDHVKRKRIVMQAGPLKRQRGRGRHIRKDACSQVDPCRGA